MAISAEDFAKFKTMMDASVAAGIDRLVGMDRFVGTPTFVIAVRTVVREEIFINLTNANPNPALATETISLDVLNPVTSIDPRPLASLKNYTAATQYTLTIPHVLEPNGIEGLHINDKEFAFDDVLNQEAFARKRRKRIGMKQDTHSRYPYLSPIASFYLKELTLTWRPLIVKATFAD